MRTRDAGGHGMRARAADGHSHCARNAGAGFAAGRRGCLTSSDSLFSFAPPFRSAYAIPEGGNPVGQSFLIRTEERNGRSWGAAETGAGGAKAETKTVRSRNNTERERAETETARGRNGIERERDEQKRPARHRRAADRRSAGMRRGFTAPRPAAAGCCRAPRANRPPALRAACP